MRLFVIFFIVINLFGKVVDRIEIVVNQFPITTFDIQKVSTERGISKNKAIAYLIDRAIIKSAIKMKGIYVDDFDIDEEMKKIAEKNRMQLFEFKNYLLKKGELNSFREKLKTDLEIKKLIDSLNISVTLKDVKEYYKLHKEQFLVPKKIVVTAYSSTNPDSLKTIIKNPLSSTSDVDIKELELDFNKTSPNLMRFLSQVEEGKFSKIVPINGKFTLFYIQQKEGSIELPQKMVEVEIYNKLMLKKEREGLNDFISRLKAKADIKFLNR